MGGSARWGLAAATAAIAAIGGLTPLVGHAAGASVSMKEDPPGCTKSGYCFTPASVSVSSGDQVTWTDQSDANQTVTRCTPSACNGVGPGTGADTGPNSAQISQGNTFSMSFTGAGTYNYYCTVHGYAVMHGTVTVATASSHDTAQGSSGSSAGSGASTTPAAGADPGWLPGGLLVGTGAALLGGAVALRRRRPTA